MDCKENSLTLFALPPVTPHLLCSALAFAKVIEYPLAVILFGPGCLFMSKMSMFQRAGMREGGLPLPPAFQYLILMIRRACDLNLVMISSLASKCQDFVVLEVFKFIS